MPTRVVYCPRNRAQLKHCPFPNCTLCDQLGVCCQCPQCHGAGVVHAKGSSAKGKPTATSRVGCTLCKGMGHWPIRPGLFDLGHDQRKPAASEGE
jgi:hypothetical protein